MYHTYRLAAWLLVVSACPVDLINGPNSQAQDLMKMSELKEVLSFPLSYQPTNMSKVACFTSHSAGKRPNTHPQSLLSKRTLLEIAFCRIDLPGTKLTRRAYQNTITLVCTEHVSYYTSLFQQSAGCVSIFTCMAAAAIAANATNMQFDARRKRVAHCNDMIKERPKAASSGMRLSGT